MQGINFYLFNEDGETRTVPENRIAILHAEAVSEEFHARFSATKRHYIYRILNRRAAIQKDRRFTGRPLTGLGELA